MIPEENSLILFKFGATKWMNALKDGKESFSCPGHYIQYCQRILGIVSKVICMRVFLPRLKKEDPRIEAMPREAWGRFGNIN